MDISQEELLNEFPPQSLEDWEQKLTEECREAGVERSLVWRTPEDIKVKAFYCAGDVNDLDYLGNYALNYRNNNSWDIRQDIRVPGGRRGPSLYMKAAEKAAFLIEKGVDSPGFDIRGLKTGPDDFRDLLSGIDITAHPVHWITDGKNIRDNLSDLLTAGYGNISGSFCADPDAGIFNKDIFKNTAEIIRFAHKNFTRLKVIAINGAAFTDAGASAVQELAFMLSLSAEYFSFLTGKGISPETVSAHIFLNSGISGNYFFEIGKLRAARILWRAMTSCYGEACAQKGVHIQSATTSWNKTAYESHINILRSTTEAMSAILGGCDTITVHAFDECYGTPGDHSLRIARNIPVILREEANFHKVADPAAGSYYIESLTDSVCTNAWKLFLEIEKLGGFIEAFNKGFINEEIGKTAGQRIEDAALAKVTILGTNTFPDSSEQISDKIAADFPASLRAASEFEKLRLAVEKHIGKRPKVFMLTFGDQVMRRARSQFASNFFAAGGYEITDNTGFSTPEEGVREALRQKADIVAVCSSDDEYAATVPVIKSIAGDRAIIVVAGRPACMEDLRKAGIADFIFSGINMTEALSGLHKKLNINF
jgi:methylmalonyl-CoA mutase